MPHNGGVRNSLGTPNEARGLCRIAALAAVDDAARSPCSAGIGVTAAATVPGTQACRHLDSYRGAAGLILAVWQTKGTFWFFTREK